MKPWTNKQWALLCATLNHGLGNLIRDSKPARPDTVVATATTFEHYLNTAQESDTDPQ